VGWGGEGRTGKGGKSGRRGGRRGKGGRNRREAEERMRVHCLLKHEPSRAQQTSQLLLVQSSNIEGEHMPLCSHAISANQKDTPAGQ
jgi:hypothetical protein